MRLIILGAGGYGRTVADVAAQTGAYDKILFLDDGTVVAVGTHNELYRSCPSYRKMVDLQKLEEEGGENKNA